MAIGELRRFAGRRFGRDFGAEEKGVGGRLEWGGVFSERDGVGVSGENACGMW